MCRIEGQAAGRMEALRVSSSGFERGNRQRWRWNEAFPLAQAPPSPPLRGEKVGMRGACRESMRCDGFRQFQESGLALEPVLPAAFALAARPPHPPLPPKGGEGARACVQKCRILYKLFRKVGERPRFRSTRQL